MEFVFKFLLIIHIVAGCIGLFVGTINIIRRKGDTPHRLFGKYFYFSMLINAIAGFIMSLINQNLFLLIVAVFSFYMTATGQRFLYLKKIDKGQSPKKIDWILTITMIAFASCFIIFGFYLFFKDNNMGIVLLVFGLISLMMTRKDISLYKGNIRNKNYWLLIHIQRMIGAYIASLTAFLVVNNTYLPPIISWLLPTIILTPLIFYWSKKNAFRTLIRRK